MEIGKKIFNKNTKAILCYCLCILLFLILNKIHIAVYIALLISNIIDLFMNNIVSKDMALGFCIMIIVLHTYIYITAIFCGIFKKINKLKLCEKILIIIFVNIGLYYFCIGKIYGQQLYAHVSLIEAVKDYSFWILPIYFLIYKFWGYITKNSVINFERIEYCISIDFIIDVLIKIRKNIKNNNENVRR